MFRTTACPRIVHGLEALSYKSNLAGGTITTKKANLLIVTQLPFLDDSLKQISFIVHRS